MVSGFTAKMLIEKGELSGSRGKFFWSAFSLGYIMLFDY
jgi:hypothetical protein